MAAGQGLWSPPASPRAGASVLATCNAIASKFRPRLALTTLLPCVCPSVCVPLYQQCRVRIYPGVAASRRFLSLSYFSRAPAASYGRRQSPASDSHQCGVPSSEILTDTFWWFYHVPVYTTVHRLRQQRMRLPPSGTACPVSRIWNQ